MGVKAPTQKRDREHHTQRNSFLFFDFYSVKKIGLCTKLSVNGTRLTRYRLPISQRRSNSQCLLIAGTERRNSQIKSTTQFSKEKTWVHIPFGLRYSECQKLLENQTVKKGYNELRDHRAQPNTGTKNSGRGMEGAAEGFLERMR